MGNTLTGGCLCGAVRHECSARPLMSGNCHCRDCQKSGGGGFVAVMAVPAASLKIEGQVKYFESKADSGNIFSRGFCPECGARLFGKSSGEPRLAMIAAASLDDPSVYQPTVDFFTSHAQPWDPMNPTLPKFAKMPQRP